MEDIKKLLVKVAKANDLMSPKVSMEKIEKQIETVVVEKPGVQILQVRDTLFGMGKIMEENIEKEYYLSTIRVGLHAAILLARCLENSVEVATWAEESLINQHTAKKALDQFSEALRNR